MRGIDEPSSQFTFTRDKRHFAGLASCGKASLRTRNRNWNSSICDEEREDRRSHKGPTRYRETVKTLFIEEACLNSTTSSPGLSRNSESELQNPLGITIRN